MEGDGLARKDRAIRYRVLRSDGGVRALAIENDGARLRDGQRARTLECYGKVLEVLPRDKQASEALKR